MLQIQTNHQVLNPRVKHRENETVSSHTIHGENRIQISRRLKATATQSNAPQGLGDLIFPRGPYLLSPPHDLLILTSIPTFPIAAVRYTWMLCGHLNHIQRWIHDPYSKPYHLSLLFCVFILVDAIIFFPVWPVNLQLIFFFFFLFIVLI